ncbi:MAG: glycosyltransferase family 61 protein [Caulobacteraceae bacterium]
MRKLGQGTVRFAGYNEAAIERSLAPLDLKLDREPPLLRLRDVLMLPKHDALYTREGVRIDESLLSWLDADMPPVIDHKAELVENRAPAAIQIPEAPHVVTQTTVFLGRFQNHFGHLITDGLCRFWALARVPRTTRLAMSNLGRSHLDEGLARTLFEAAGAPLERFQFVKHPTLFRDLILPLPALQRGRRLYRGYDRPHRRIARRLTAGYRNPLLDRPVYLSRSALPEAQRTRRIDHEEMLEERVTKEGYVIIHPELLSLRDQIYLFQQNRPVIGVIGSAVHTALFRNGWRKKPLAVLTGPGAKGRFILTDAVKSLDSVYVNGLKETTPEEHRQTPGYPRSFQIDVDKTMDLLGEAGFLGRGR